MIRIINTTALDLAFVGEGLSQVFQDHWKIEKAKLKTPGKVLSAERVIKHFSRVLRRDKVLFVTDRDLECSLSCGFPEEGTMKIFGMAAPQQGVAVLSAGKLAGKDRLLKEAIHEVGHLFFLNHCKAPCVMAFSGTIGEIDKKNKTLCASCKANLGAQRFLF